MAVEYEYLANDPSTWRVHKPPTFPDWFQKELVRIAGLNRHGQPNLQLVWGGTHKSDKSAVKGRLKYLCGLSPQQLEGYQYLDKGSGQWKPVKDLADAPEDAAVAPVTEREQLGLLRWIIEVWTSPEDLEAAQRFTRSYLPGELKPILRSFPREGVYDTFLIIENRQGRFRHVGHDVLEVVHALWKNREKPLHEREAEAWYLEDAEKEAEEKHEAELDRAMWQGDLKLDKEEKERRAEFWAKYEPEKDTTRSFV